MKQYSIKIIFILFLTLDSVNAQTYANSSTGNDGTGNGSSAAPYKTFYKAYTVVASYGIIDLTGTFTWTDTDETADAQYTGYTISKHLTIRGQGPGSTIIQAHSSANSADRRVFTITDGYTVTFKNLSIKHGKGFAGYIGQTYFTYHGGAIGSAYGSSTGLTLNLENVNISTNYSSYTIAGVYCEGKITVNKCTFENNSATSGNSALQLEHCGTQKQRDIVNSTFYNNTTTGVDYSTIYVDRFGANIMNCTLINNTNGIKAYALYANSKELYITNCIIANSTGWDLYAYNGTANGVIVRNSIVEVEKSGGITISYTSCLTGDQANLNVTTPTTNGGNNTITPYLEIASNSVAVNAGTSGSFGNASYSGAVVTTPTTDQRSRTRNGTFDMGAFEYGSSTILDPFPVDYSTSQNQINYGNGSIASTTSNGLWFKVGTTLATANFINYGNNNTTGLSTSDLTSASCISRTGRIWYLDVTGTVSADVILDNSVATGISITAATASNYKLLSRSGTSGDFTVVASGSSIASTDQITFSSVSLSDGYYAVGTINESSSPLPVELKSFTANTRNENVILNWSTVTESANYGFDIERRAFTLRQAQNNNWIKLGFIKGSGTSSVENNYTYRDTRVNSGKYQYRLKQIDLDGTTEYSNQVEVQVGILKTRLRSHPNPFNPVTEVRYYLPEKTEVEITLFDIMGRRVGEVIKQSEQEEGEYEIKLNSSDYKLTSGIYFLTLKTNKDRITEKIVLLR